MTRKIKKLVSSQKVTSRKGKVNGRDGFWSTVYAGFVFVGLGILQCWEAVKAVVESSADVIVPYLKMIPAPERPFWICMAAGLGVGVVTLIARGGMGEKPVKPKRPRARKKVETPEGPPDSNGPQV